MNKNLENILTKSVESSRLEFINDTELIELHQVCKFKRHELNNGLMKSRAEQYLPLVEKEIQQRQETLRKAKEDELEKSKANAGEIRTWGSKKYQKQANGKWMEVSEHGMTKEQHKKTRNQLDKKITGLEKDFHSSQKSDKKGRPTKEEIEKHWDARKEFESKNNLDTLTKEFRLHDKVLATNNGLSDKQYTEEELDSHTKRGEGLPNNYDNSNKGEDEEGKKVSNSELRQAYKGTEYNELNDKQIHIYDFSHKPELKDRFLNHHGGAEYDEHSVQITSKQHRGDKEDKQLQKSHIQEQFESHSKKASE